MTNTNYLTKVQVGSPLGNHAYPSEYLVSKSCPTTKLTENSSEQPVVTTQTMYPMCLSVLIARQKWRNYLRAEVVFETAVRNSLRRK